MINNKGPKHVAIIMDGNRRWEKKQALAPGGGHRAGLQNALVILEKAIEMKVEYISYFVFSTENWNRSQGEIAILMNLISYVLKNFRKKMIELGAKVIFIGDIDSMPEGLAEEIRDFAEATKNGNTIAVQIAINYGGRQEIISAINRIIVDCREKSIIIDERKVGEYMQSRFPDPDLIIRTSGEKRLSNFLLWQSAYAELYFSDKLWPDFTSEDFVLALGNYHDRKRNYGI